MSVGGCGRAGASFTRAPDILLRLRHRRRLDANEHDNDGSSEGFIWDARRGIRTLADEAAGGWLAPVDINDQGIVVGNVSPYDAGRAFVWSAEQGVRAIEHPRLADAYRSVSGLNRWGQIVGDAAGVQGFVLEPYGALREVGSFEQRGQTYVMAINELGTVVGSSVRQGNSTAYIARPGHPLVALESPDPTLIAYSARDINNLHQVVGRLGSAAVTSRAYVWSPWSGLEQIGSSDNSEAFAINDRGQIVGRDYARAILFERTSGVRDLNDLVHSTSPAPSGFVLEAAVDINENGWIVGGARSADGVPHAFAAVPLRSGRRCPAVESL